MFVPCRDHCYLRYGKQYTEECDTTCDYARVCLENKKLKEIIDKLDTTIVDKKSFKS